MNGQPWYYIADGGKIHVYYKPSLGGLLGKMYNLTDLDVGISLCHLAVACLLYTSILYKNSVYFFL